MNRVTMLLLLNTIISIILITIYFANGGSYVFVVFNNLSQAQSIYRTLPLYTIKLVDNPNGIMTISITLNSIYYYIFKLSIASALVSLVTIVTLWIVKRRVIEDSINRDKFKFLIVAIPLIAAFLLIIPLPMEIYVGGSSNYVVAMTDIGVNFGGFFTLISAVSLIVIWLSYRSYGELTELSIELELTESNTMLVESDELTESNQPNYT